MLQLCDSLLKEGDFVEEIKQCSFKKYQGNSYVFIDAYNDKFT